MGFHRPSRQAIALLAIGWTLVWYTIGWFTFKQMSALLLFSLMMIGLALGYGVRGDGTRRLLVRNLIIWGQLCLIFLASILVRDILFAMALLFVLLGELCLSLGITPTTVRVSIAAALTLFLLQLSFDGVLSVIVVAAFMLAPLPLVAGVTVAFIEQEREQHTLQTRLITLEMAHLSEVIRIQERQRLARELHDTLAQGVVGITLQLEAASVYLTQHELDRAQSILQGTMQRARITLQEARQAITSLRTAEDVNLRIREEIERFQAATSIPCHIDVCRLDEQEPRINEVVQLAIAEGLINIARHAHATEVAIRVAMELGAMQVTIHDNGIGLDPDKLLTPGHYGLQGLAERIRQRKGQFTLTSQRGGGTTLHLSLPREA